MISKELAESLSFAMQEAQLRQHEYVGVEHVLFALLDDRLVRRAIVACGGSGVIERLKEALDTHLKDDWQSVDKGEEFVPQPSLGFQRVMHKAMEKVLAAGKEKLHGDVVLLSIYGEPECFAEFYLLRENIQYFDLVSFIAHGDKEYFLPHASQGEEGAGSTAEAESEEPVSLLSLYTVDLCEQARQGKLDPLIGAESALERGIQVLCRRKKNNPLYVGEAGVGKTALVEGLASFLVGDKVPTVLRGASIHALDLGGLLAGTKYRGEFEQRLKGLLRELQDLPCGILFVDELHTLMRAGAASGAVDAVNILKPFLASGKLRCIGATTYREYRQHVLPDQALSRRMQKIDVEEPSQDVSLKILQGLQTRYEEFHNLQYSSGALKAAVELSARYLRERLLPDKAIDVLDEAGAQVVSMRLGESKGGELVGPKEVRQVIARWARIPQERLSQAESRSLKGFADSLRKRVYGQDAAVEAIAQTLQLARSGLGAEERPLGCFLFVGPTGVGKTEMARQTADLLAVPLLRFDMSEYMERHAVSRLIGAPPGYVGYEEGGLLTDGVYRQPHCVLLLDEIEKAHADVHNILLQIMDRGVLTDTNGRSTDFRQVLLIMTSNVGAAEMARNQIGFRRENPQSLRPDTKILGEAFKPEFRNRLDHILAFQNLSQELVEALVDKFCAELKVKLKKKRVSLDLKPRARDFLAREGYEPAYGARPLARTIERLLKRRLVSEMLFGELRHGGKVEVDYNGGEELEFSFF